jgi:hypothetical protein
MERGDMVQIGDPRTVARAYFKLNFGQLPHAAPVATAAGTGTVIADAWFEDASGERVTSASQEEPLRMCFEARLAEDLVDPVFTATLRTELGHTIIVARSDQHGARSGSYRSGETVTARFEVPNWLTSSRYTMTPSLAREGTGEQALALVEDMTSMMIHGNSTGGIVEMPIDVRIDRA